MPWIQWTQRLQAIAQNGLTYATDKFDIERYQQLQDIASEIIATYTNHEFHEVRNFLTGETGYATPKADMRGVVFQENKILLVKETSDNLWTLPGGWADVLGSPSENVEREVFEESGYLVKARRLLAVYDRSRHGHYPETPLYVYKFFFLCEIVGGEPKTSMETSEIGFFDVDALPELSVARVTEKQIRRMFELKALNQTDFD